MVIDNRPSDWKTRRFWKDVAGFSHNVNPNDPDPETTTIHGKIPQWVIDRRNSDQNLEPILLDNNTIFNYGTAQELASKRDNSGTTSGQEWGFYSEKFDEVMRESPVPQDKRVIAETIELKVTSDTFRKHLARRIKEGKVRYHRGSHRLIE